MNSQLISLSMQGYSGALRIWEKKSFLAWCWKSHSPSSPEGMVVRNQGSEERLGKWDSFSALPEWKKWKRIGTFIFKYINTWSINNLAIVVIWIDDSSASCFYGCLKILESPFIFFIYFMLKEIVVTLIELLISSEVISLGSRC